MGIFDFFKRGNNKTSQKSEAEVVRMIKKIQPINHQLRKSRFKSNFYNYIWQMRQNQTYNLSNQSQVNVAWIGNCQLKPEGTLTPFNESN